MSKLQVAKDLLYIFFKLKYYPDNYGPCRLWEKERREWVYYYGSSYEPYQRQRLRKRVQRYEYQILYNDKEFCEYFCRGLNVPMPRYFGVVGGEDNTEKKIKKYLLDPLINKVILKPIMGHAGRGIMLAECTEDGIIIKTTQSKIELRDCNLRSRYIIQEVVRQHHDINEFSPLSINTIRVVTLYALDGDVILVSVSMRFGKGDSFVDNWSAGGVSVGVNVHNGTLKKYAYDKIGNRYIKHPSSDKKFEGFKVPAWDEVVKIARRIQEASPFYRLIGCDIAITPDGPVLIEANANPDIVYQEQVSGPILSDKRVFFEFMKYDLLVNCYQEKIYDSVD